MTIRVGFQKDGITPQDLRLSASVFSPPASATAATSGLTGPGGALSNTGAMTATIGAFRAIIQGTSNALQGAYPFVNDAASPTLTFADGHATLGRRDLVVAEVRDSVWDAGANQDGRIRIVPGTPHASPTAPPVPTSCIPLWEVLVPAAVNAGNGGITWGSALTDRRVYVGWQQLDIAGLSGMTLGALNVTIPTWGVLSGGAPSYADAVSLSGYGRQGRMIDIQYQITMGPGTTMGSGPWTFGLPVAMRAGRFVSASCMGIDVSAGATYAGAASLDPGAAQSAAITLLTSGVAFWSGTHPFAWASGDVLVMNARFEAAS